MSKLATLSFLAVFVFFSATFATEPGPNTWPGWRGPASAGSTPTGSYASGWADGKNILWTAPLPGKGCSTPVVWGDSIFITVPIEGEFHTTSVLQAKHLLAHQVPSAALFP